MAVHIEVFTFNPFQENSYVLYDDKKNCVIIDPGCYEKEEEQVLLNFIKSNDLSPLALLNTHAHIDHVLGNNFILENYSIEHYLHNDDLTTLNAVPNYAVATAQIRAQHDNRVRRLFSCIIKYIIAGCSMYVYLQTNFKISILI